MEIRRLRQIACTVIFSILLLLGRIIINKSELIQLFWGSGSSVFNIGVINSDLIIGVSIFFFASNAIYGLCAFGVEVTLYILIFMFEWK